jgi:hypothetical protein
MNENWFSIPLYHKSNILTQQEIQQLYDGFVFLKEKNLLANFNGTSLLTFNTAINSVLDYFNLDHIKEKIRLYCNDYLINCNIKFKNIVIESNWLIGYNKNDYQGEHNHGYDNNYISGVVYIKIPANSSPIVFLTPNPFVSHICLQEFDTVSYVPTEGMILIFPSFLKHKVLPNKNIMEDELRLGLSFNARVFN